MSVKKLLKKIDFGLLFVILSIFILGMLMIASATEVSQYGLTREVKIQGIAFMLGLIAIIVIMMIDYQFFGRMYWVLYALSIGALLLVYVPGLGIVRNGANSWISLGIIDVQTSEFAKLGFIIFYAKLLEDKQGKLDTVLDVIVPVGVLLPFLALIMLQPDLGSALVFVIIAAGMLFISQLNIKIIVGAIVAFIASAPIIYGFLKPHQQERFKAFLNPNDPSLPGYYQVMQSKITIGSGMFKGKGLFKGQYHRYDYLPVQSSDFIFAVLGEELGFLGGALLIFLYFLFLMRMFRISLTAKDDFGKLIVTGVIFMFAFQIFENIGMTMGIMPVTGITLPFFSYGGSSIITSMLAIGLVLNVYARRKQGSFLD